MILRDAYIALHDWRTRRRMERAFQTDRDPYRPATPPERRKHAALNALLSDRRYRSVLDAGCAEGELTRFVAPLADRVVALDVSETAIWRAMVNLADVPNVSFIRRNLRDFHSEIEWDLIILSEVLPCLDAGDRWTDELRRLASDLTGALAPGGRLVLVSDFSSGAGFSAAARYATLFSDTPGLRPVREILTGGTSADRRYALSLFERPAAEQAVALPVSTAADAAHQRAR